MTTSYAEAETAQRASNILCEHSGHPLTLQLSDHMRCECGVRWEFPESAPREGWMQEEFGE